MLPLIRIIFNNYIVFHLCGSSSHSQRICGTYPDWRPSKSFVTGRVARKKGGNHTHNEPLKIFSHIMNRLRGYRSRSNRILACD